jgi:acyl-CoA thioester hydrolase
LEDLLAGYPVVIETPVAWGEMDALRHVNNTVYFRYFESARMEYFERAGFWRHMERTGVGPILASTSCRFKLPLTYPDVVLIGASVPEVGEDRFTMRYAVASRRHARVAAEGEGLIVAYDYRELKKSSLPAEMKAGIARIEAGRGGGDGPRHARS